MVFIVHEVAILTSSKKKQLAPKKKQGSLEIHMYDIYILRGKGKLGK